MDPYLIEDLMEKFVEWIDNHEELPKTLDRILLVRYLKACDFDLEKAKSLLYKSLKIRTANPHIFTHRDPFSPEMEEVIEIVQLVPMIERTPDNRRVTFIRLVDSNSDKICFNHVIKAFYMAADIRLATMDEVWAEGEVPVFDMANTSWRHLTKIVLSTVRLFMKYNQEAHPVTVRQVHIVNCNGILNAVLATIKPMLKAEVAAYIHTHLPDSDTLFEFIPRNVVPVEYGGTAGSIENIRTIWLNYLESYRTYLKDDDRFRLMPKKC